MDKQQATAYILREFAQGASQENIAIRLSVLIGAPQELTAKFVAQTVAQHTHAATQPISEALVKQQSAQFMPSELAAVSASPPPPSVSAVPSAASPSWSSSPAVSAAPSVANSSWSSSPAVSAAPSVASSSWSPPPASSPAWSPPAPAIPQQTDAELEAFILRALMKTSKQSEVVMMVCERANLSWNDAQRLVARVATQNRKKLTGRQNMIVIPLAAIAIIAGLLLAYAGLSEILMVATAVQAIQAGNPAAIPIEARDPMRNAPWAVVFGIGLAVGGGFGLFKALKTQFDG
jgi:hypothetical protein